MNPISTQEPWNKMEWKISVNFCKETIEFCVCVCVEEGTLYSSKISASREEVPCV